MDVLNLAVFSGCSNDSVDDNSTAPPVPMSVSKINQATRFSGSLLTSAMFSSVSAPHKVVHFCATDTAK
jgi:hypothetical protein